MSQRKEQIKEGVIAAPTLVHSDSSKTELADKPKAPIAIQPPTPLFSVIIPAYNYAHVLPRAIRSALKQEGDDYEIIIINDGSTDHTSTVVAPFLANHPELRYIEQHNRGPAATRNRGIEISRGEYLVFLDADDELRDDALTIFRENISDVAPEAVIGSYYSIDEQGKRKYRGNTYLPRSPEKAFMHYFDKKITGAHGAFAVQRHFFDITRYDERLRQAEDIPLFAQMLVSLRCVVEPRPIANIYKHPDSLRHNAELAAQAENAVVDVLFTPGNLPRAFLQHRNRIIARRQLSLFRTAYHSRDYSNARQYFHNAWKAHWPSTFRSNYFRKYIRSYLRSK